MQESYSYCSLMPKSYSLLSCNPYSLNYSDIDILYMRVQYIVDYVDDKFISIQLMLNLILGIFSGLMFFQLEDDGPNIFFDRCVCACVRICLFVCVCVLCSMCCVMCVYIVFHNFCFRSVNYICIAFEEHDVAICT